MNLNKYHFALLFFFFAIQITVYAQKPKLIIPLVHSYTVSSAKFNLDGKKFITCSEDRTAKFWDVATGKLLANLDSHTKAVYAANISPDNKRIVTASLDKTAILWDAATGTIISVLDIICGNIPDYIPAFSPDGKMLINIANNTYQEDYSITCYNTTDGNQLARIKNPDGEIDRVYFSGDGNKITVFSKKNNPKIWNTTNGALLDSLKSFDTSASSRFYAEDGIKMITCQNSGTSSIWDIESGKIAAQLPQQPGNIVKALFTLDGKIVMTFTDSGTVKAWDAANGKLISRLDESITGIILACFSPDGKKLITNSDQVISKVWDVLTGKLITTIKHSDNSSRIYNKPDYACFSPDGEMLLTISKSHGINIWDAESGKPLGIFDNSKLYGSATSAVFSPDGKKILVAHNEMDFILYTATIVDVPSRKELINLKAHTDMTEFVVFSPDGSKLVTTHNRPNFVAKMWDMGTGKLMYPLFHTQKWGHQGARINSVLFSPGSNKVITTAVDNTSILWDAASGNRIADLTEGLTKNNYIVSLSYSPDGSKIFAMTNNDSARIFDANGKTLVKIDSSMNYVRTAVFSHDGQRVITGINQLTKHQMSTMADEPLRPTRIWDVETGRLVGQFNGYTKEFSAPFFSSDGKMAAYTSTGTVTDLGDETDIRFLIAIWDVNTGRQLTKTKWNAGQIYSLDFSPDGGRILATVSDNSLTIWQTKTGAIAKKIDNSPNGVVEAVFSQDGKKIAGISVDGIAKIWDAGSGGLLAATSVYSNDVLQLGSSLYAPPQAAAGNARLNEVKFSNDNKIILTTDADKKTKIWNVNNGSFIADLNWDLNRFSKIEYTADRSRAAAVLSDHTVEIWDAASGKHIYTFLALDSVEFINQVPAGYYQGSIGAVKLLHYVTGDLKIISFEQLDVKYNRPDKVLEAINNSDTALIAMYRNAWYKRIKKLGIDTSSFRDDYSVPEADFSNRNDLDVDQKKERLSLKIMGMDSSYNLDRFNVWVNEVPVFGQRGYSIRQNNSNRVEKTVAIQLSAGENRIETSVTNVNGTESYRMPLIVNYNPAQPPSEKIYFIGIGIDRFADADYNLQYSVKDIRDLSAKLKARFGNNISIDTLFNEHVTINNIKALKKQLLQTGINDKVIISYSGHGLLSKDYDYYLSTYSVNFKNPVENGLAYDELENLLDSIPARKKLMLIDACHSGEVDKEGFQTVQINKAALEANHVVSRGVDLESTDTSSGKLGLYNSFELMQSLFVNVGKSTGATIISAAAGTEFALEFGNLKNGVFTYSLMEAMDKYPNMKISELKKIVGARVEQLTNGMQKPTSRNEAIAVDWNVW